MRQGMMKRRRGWVPAGLGGGVVSAAMGGLLLASRLGQGVEPLCRSLDAEPRSFLWRGFRVVHYERGQGEPVLLLHSVNAAASAYEMREPFERLGQGCRVHALDLLGFGASERPAIRYSAGLYVDLIADFVHPVI